MAAEENDGATTRGPLPVDGEDRLARQERLQQKYDLCRRTKDEQVSNIKKLQSELQQILKKMPKRPRENVKELDEKIEYVSFWPLTFGFLVCFRSICL